MTAPVRLAAFGLALVGVFAAAAALGSAVGPLERGQTDRGHGAEPMRAFLEFAAGGRVPTAPFTINVAW